MRFKFIFGIILIWCSVLGAQYKQECYLIGLKKLDPSQKNDQIISCETPIDTPLTLNFDQKIGTGAFGIVYSGTITYQHNNILVNVPIVAKQIKIIPSEAEGYESVSENISALAEVNQEFINLNKISKLASIKKYIINPYAFFLAGDYAYIIMEFGGMTLDKYYETNKENHEIIFKSIAKQLRELLAALKAANISHLDIHPKNILVNEADQIKIIDFALTTEIGHPVVIAGKLGYRDPNIFSFKNAYAGYDEFSVASVLYELLNGKTIIEVLLSPLSQDQRKVVNIKQISELFNQELKSCTQDNQCQKTQKLLLESLNPDYSQRKPLEIYFQSLK